MFTTLRVFQRPVMDNRRMGDVNSGKPAASPRRTFRKVSLIVLGAAALGAVATAGAAFIAYDKATEIDREHPEVVLENFVATSLNRYDDARNSLYRCEQADISEIGILREALAQETAKGTIHQVVLGPVSRASQDELLAEIQVRRTSEGITSKELQYWSFTMVDEGGWRVCDATQVLVPGPSPSIQPTLQ